MKSLRLFSFFLVCSSLLLLKAQTVFEENPPIGQNVRLAWAIDADGGTDGDEFKGVEATYASEIYPLDQMLISYKYSKPNGSYQQTVLFGLEEFYPIAVSFKFYGVAGVGYMWTDFGDDISGDSSGWVGKLGAGGIYDLSESFDLYAEIAFYGSTQDLWLDGDNSTDSQNWGALLGFRFKY